MERVNLNLNVPVDVRQQLQAWTKHNATSMVAEVTRAVRERAARERQEAAR